MAADLRELVQGMENITISNSGPSEYSYFDSNAAFGTSNAWAGARHWKYATRKRTAALVPATTTSADETAEGTENATDAAAAATGKGKKTKKATFKKGDKTTAGASGIEFTLDLVEDSAFDLPKARARTDPTVQTAATLAKQKQAASTLCLPADAKVQVKDLCKLYLAPLVMIPATDAQRAMLAQSAQAVKKRSGSSNIDKFLGGQVGSERVWGLGAPANVQTATRVAAGAAIAPVSSFAPSVSGYL